MNINEIIIAVATVCIISLVVGIILSIAEKLFFVEVNEKENEVREKLPGSNCGGCGRAGCDALAKAIANGEAPVDACPVGGEKTAREIAEIMGKPLGEVKKMVAYVKCDGNCEKRTVEYNYFGIDSCVYASKMPGSSQYACKNGCLGFGSCARVCPQRAIRIIDGKAVVDESLCIACGKCVKICPHDLIELIPIENRIRVQCSSRSKGKEVSNACTSGCIACGICSNVCPHDAVIFEDNIAKIDYDKCTQCGLCYEKCPRKIIKKYA